MGCKQSTCPKGDPDAQKELADKKAEIEKVNRQRAAPRFQGALDVSEDEAVSDEENNEFCLVSSHMPLTSSRNPDLSSKVFPSFLGAQHKCTQRKGDTFISSSMQNITRSCL